MGKERILVVDDESIIRWSLRQNFELQGYLVHEASNGQEALQQFESGTDLVLLDHRLPDTNGLELLRQMVASDSEIPVIMLTAHACVDQAVEAMKSGAYHYAGKPFDLDEVSLIVERALETSRLRRQVRALTSSSQQAGFNCIIGESTPIKKCKALLSKIASSPSSTVLITGDSGTGKDLAAKAIHLNSERADGPFLNITCSALSAYLLESELFGHERGAFTDAKSRKKGLFEQAHSGTIFLDEIGEMDPVAQSKLLGFLEEKTFRRVGGSTDIRADVRVIAATNVDLAEAVRNHLFREDLYYRLAVLTVQMSPLRERNGDIALIIEHFICRFNREFYKNVRGLTPMAMDRLSNYPWPGNVRELRNAVERAVLLSENVMLAEDDFPMLNAASPLLPQPEFRLPSNGVDISKLERSLVIQALERAKGNKTLAASLLGMNRDQIRYRMYKFSISNRKSV